MELAESARVPVAQNEGCVKIKHNPDLNITECDYMEGEKQKMLNQLLLQLRLNFGGVSADFFEKLKLSLLKRMEAVIKVKSGCSKY